VQKARSPPRLGAGAGFLRDSVVLGLPGAHLRRARQVRPAKKPGGCPRKGGQLGSHVWFLGPISREEVYSVSRSLRPCQEPFYWEPNSLGAVCKPRSR